MIIEGVKLMFVGMTTVLLFLSLMILLIQFVSFLTRDATARELEAIQKERELQSLKRKKKKEASADSDEDIAVIAAAIAAFEAERFART
ncbi:hypothetical protein DGMP_33540 [Desulfomarina profundi]|uniref:Uncharacterized protein n=1 Tax=Desulfomarina profundi TaxID=2772557 RepID=A0A8D5JT02_9BACT|nr:OadG family transporter subunit [Desulfomarina profundi]BCL62661.1 hypothetical protein DGMP_33540 [Desulfomarina profundi]